MNKSELVDAVSTATGLARREAESAVNAVVETVIAEVKKKDGRVAIVGFGSFTQTSRKARMGRNPQTGTPVKIAASKGVRFGPSTTFKAILNGKAPAAKAPAKKAPAKKAPAAKAPAKKAPAAKAPAKKAPAAKAPAKKAPAKKAPAKKR